MSDSEYKPRRKCEPGCKCLRHNAFKINPRDKCKPDCQCGKHFRTKEHNELISRGVRKSLAAKRSQRV